MEPNQKFTFEISLSVLNHLGRNLYRSFVTVIGEAISNSWDADAQNVWIFLDRRNRNMVVKDDGVGMDAIDFQTKFLKIGYSKRKDGNQKSIRERPFIGRKGIGKLALLSCAEKISVISKKENNDYVGGLIDNSGLDAAIKEDLIPQQYPLDTIDFSLFKKYKHNHKRGTIIHFENIKDGIRNTEDYLIKVIALYFRFSLIDKSFNIFFNGKKITLEHLKDLVQNTQLVWKINNIEDPFIDKKLTKSPECKRFKQLTSELSMNGFIASVIKPSALKIISTEERVSIDLFVNGRLREKDILKHIPTNRHVESYLYGQIHFNSLDDTSDRFTSSREGIVSDDPLFKELLESLRKILTRVFDDWDKWRLELKQDGDPDNPRLMKKERKSVELFNEVSKDYKMSKDSPNRRMVEEWVSELSDDAKFNFSSYAECFVSENLVRKYVKAQNVIITPKTENKIQDYKLKEARNKSLANISIELRKNNDELSYLSMNELTEVVDKVKDRIKDAGLTRDATEYKPLRDAMAHTALLTDEAKLKLTSVYNNIKARIYELLNNAKR